MFILHHHSQTCISCRRTETWSHLYTADGPIGPTGAARLKPCETTPAPDAPVAVISVPMKPIPICALCLPADSAQRGAEARRRFEETRHRKAAELRSASPTPAAAKQQRIPTLDELV
jgi:hypothetical protein